MNRWLIGYVSTVVAVLAIATVREVFQLDASAWASWVQALGSIGAIIGAVWVAKYQERSTHRKRLWAILAVAQAAHARTNELAGYLKGEEHRESIAFNYHRSIIDGLVSAMSAVPMHEIGVPSAIIAFAGMRDQLVFMAQAIEILIKGPWQHRDMKDGLEEAQKHYVGKPGEFREVFLSYVGVLEGNVRTHVAEIERCFRVLERDLA